MTDKIFELYRKYKEIMLYLVFGVSTTVVNWVIYISFVKVGSAIVIANSVAWIGAVTFAYVTNKLFVFESKSTSLDVVIQEAVSFFLARTFSGIFEIFGPGILITIGLDQELFGIKGFVAKVAISVIVIVMNYILSKLFVFRKKKEAYN